MDLFQLLVVVKFVLLGLPDLLGLRGLPDLLGLRGLPDLLDL